MSVASTEDVAERLGRPLNTDEQLTVTNLLEDAEVEITSWGAGGRLTDPLWRAAVIKVECDMVLRAAQLSAKTTALVPQIEDIDRMSLQGSTLGSRPGVYLSRFDRRTLGLKLNGSVYLGPAAPIGWSWDETC